MYCLYTYLKNGFIKNFIDPNDKQIPTPTWKKLKISKYNI